MSFSGTDSKKWFKGLDFLFWKKRREDNTKRDYHDIPNKSTVHRESISTYFTRDVYPVEKQWNNSKYKTRENKFLSERKMHRLKINMRKEEWNFIFQFPIFWICNIIHSKRYTCIYTNIGKKVNFISDLNLPGCHISKIIDSTSYYRFWWVTFDELYLLFRFFLGSHHNWIREKIVIHFSIFFFILGQRDFGKNQLL